MRAVTASRIPTAAAPAERPAWSDNSTTKWLLVGLLVSLLLHATLCFVFYRTTFQPVSALAPEKRPPPLFKVQSVDTKPQPLDKALLEQPAEAAKTQADKTDVQLPDEKKSFEKLLAEVHASAATPDDTADVLPDKPRVEQTNLNSVINEIEKTTAQVLSKSPNATREQSLLNDSAVSGRPQPALNGTEIATSTTIKRPNSFNSNIPGDSAGPRIGRAPGMSDLDSLLSQAGPLSSGTAFKMPSDLLFDYDSADLRENAVSELQKVGTLIKRNPKARFTIEGHSDAFGSDEYNVELSERRAESVKSWLVTNMTIDPAQIQTRGFGKTKLLTSPNASMEEQKVNRRVVVVVHTGT